MEKREFDFSILPYLFLSVNFAVWKAGDGITTAQYGRFDEEGVFTKTIGGGFDGDLDTTNDTIEVIDGELQGP